MILPRPRLSTGDVSPPGQVLLPSMKNDGRCGHQACVAPSSAVSLAGLLVATLPGSAQAPARTADAALTIEIDALPIDGLQRPLAGDCAASARSISSAASS